MSGTDAGPGDVTSQMVLAYLRELASEELELSPIVARRIKPETSLIGGLQLDSLAQTVLVTQVEEHYGFFFEDEDRERLQQAETVADLISIIVDRANANGGQGAGNASSDGQ